jgi:FkbM family methyltransferase
MKRLIRRMVFKYDLLFQFYYTYFYKPSNNSIQQYIDNLSRSKEIFFIQIGANDGMYSDPIYKFIRRDKWKGVLIEPQKKIFARLRYNYRKMGNLFFENAAISDRNGEFPLYKIAFTDADWASGISSFRKEALENNIKSGYVERKARESGIPLPPREEFICTEIVNCITFNDLVAKYNPDRIDLLQLDAEEYDYEIIKSIDFQKVKPMNIIYEHAGLSGNDKTECEIFLKNLGYKIFPDESDTLAFIDTGSDK